MPRRQPTDSVDAEISCQFCLGITDLTDMNWLCLCTTDVRRVHRSCSQVRNNRGVHTKVCHQCGLDNQHEALSSARRTARVVIIGAGSAGECAICTYGRLLTLLVLTLLESFLLSRPRCRQVPR